MSAVQAFALRKLAAHLRKESEAHDCTFEAELLAAAAAEIERIVGELP